MSTDDSDRAIRNRWDADQQIVENVLEIIGGATTIEDGIKRPIDRGDVEGALYHMRQAIEASQRLPRAAVKVGQPSALAIHSGGA